MKKSQLQSLIREEIRNVLKEAIGKGLEVVKDDEYAQPGEFDDAAVAVDYSIMLNGKQIGNMKYESYFGNITGKIYGRPLPDIGEWKPIGVDKNKLFDDDGDRTPEYMKGVLLAFLKSSTGMKWLSVLKKKTPDAFAGMSMNEDLWNMISGKDTSIDKQVIAKKYWDEIVKIMKIDNAKIEANFKNLDRATQKQFVTVAAKAAADGSLKNMKAIASLMMDIENSQPVFGDKIKELCAKIAAV